MAFKVHDSIEASAIDWHIRLRDGDGAAWDAFVLWLEADPLRAAAYDAVEAADEAVVPLLPPVRPAMPVARPQRPLRRWAAWGTGLAVACAVAIVVAPKLQSQRYYVATGPGQQRIIALDASTQVVLNGSTRITLERGNTRFAALTAGEALFRVRHDPAAPFQLEVGDNRIVDVGTVFNVVNQGGEVRVAVAEGAVLYNPKAEAVTLHAGDALVDGATGQRIVLERSDRKSIGGWQQGRLIYSDASLSRIAADLSRSLGVPIRVAPQLAARRFSGALVLDRSGDAQLTRVAQVLQVGLQRSGRGWTIVPVIGAKN